MIQESLFYCAETLIADLADDIVARLIRAVAERGAATLVATGGTTPGQLYDVLSRRDAPWAQVTVTLSDERWLDPADAASNEALLRRRLLQGAAAQARLIPLKTKADAAADAVDDRDRALRALPRPFDVTLLGMGADGHIASLFPHAEELDAALADAAPLVCAVRRADAAGSAERLSMTRNALLASRSIDLLIQGEEKRAVFRAAMQPGDIRDLPVRMILQQQRTPVRLWWSP